MGQGAPRPSGVRVVVYAPLLVPESRGEAFVILRVRSVRGQEKSWEELIDTFPAARVLPVATASDTLLEIGVVTSFSAERFRLGKRQHFSTVVLPLSLFSHNWETQSKATSSSKQGGPAPGWGTCFWLGLEEGAYPRDDQNFREHFEHCQKLAQRLDIAKVGIALRDPDEFRASSSACAGPSTVPSKTDPFGQVLDNVQDMMAGFHRSIEKMSVNSEVKQRQDLEKENALLRSRMEQQKEKYEVEIGYLLSVVRNNHSEDLAAKKEKVDVREEERQRRQAEETKKQFEDEAEKLRQEVAAQRDAVEEMEKRALNAEKAKEETLKLFSASHQELKWMSAWLAQGEQKQEALREENDKLKRRLETYEGPPSPKDGEANGYAKGNSDTSPDSNAASYLLTGNLDREEWEDLSSANIKDISNS